MPELHAPAQLLLAVDIAAAVVFAVSGALVASRKGLDIVGFMWLAVLTGVGGGTVRDLLLGVPVFWMVDPVHIVACLVTAVVVHFTAHLVESRYKLLLWFDALGLALVTLAGTAKGSTPAPAPWSPSPWASSPARSAASCATSSATSPR